MKQQSHMVRRIISAFLVLAFMLSISTPVCRGLIAYAEEAGAQTAQTQEAQPEASDAESAAQGTEQVQEKAETHKLILTKWKPVMLGALAVGGIVVVLALLGSGSENSNNNGTVAYTSSYIGNKNSKIVHQSRCKNLPDAKNRVYFTSYSVALAEGYTPCSICLK